MDLKSIRTLEFERVLENLAQYAAFSASEEMARKLQPTANLQTAIERQALTTEARLLLSMNSDITVAAGISDRWLCAAQHGMLEAEASLLDVRYTLIAARELSRTLVEQAEKLPLLAGLGEQLPPPPGIIEAISRTISDRGEVLDNASPKLSVIRRAIKIAHDRLLSRLQQMYQVPNKGKLLQEAIITQRNGRYVIPLRAEFKGKINGLP